MLDNKDSLLLLTYVAKSSAYFVSIAVINFLKVFFFFGPCHVVHALINTGSRFYLFSALHHS